MAQPLPRPRDRNGFKIAIICALSSEADMVESVFDHFDDDGSYGKVAGDPNAYVTGIIGKHNVVLAQMSNTGGNNAAIIAQGLNTSFRGIEVAFVVGVCGVVPINPITKEEVILGDCIISTAVVQYDLGRQYTQGFQRKDNIEDSLGRTSIEVRALIETLKRSRNQLLLSKRLAYHLKELLQTGSKIRYPGKQADRLYEPDYEHQHRRKEGEEKCTGCQNELEICEKDCKSIRCDETRVVKRERLQPSPLSADDATVTLPADKANGTLPMIHFGRIGSANTVMKSGLYRDCVAEDGQLIAFEMEGSGVWDRFPTIVIKSACDYADSHKNKDWQPYAAATAAAGLKAFLERWEVTNEILSSRQETVQKNSRYMIPFFERQRFVGREGKLEELEQRLLVNKECHRLAIFGLGGVGKTQLASAFCQKVKTRYPDYSIFWVSALSAARFKQDYTKIAEKCLIGAGSSEDELLSVVQEYLSSQESGKWLLVIDNSDDKVILDESILDWLPQSEDGVLLFTTRDKVTAVEATDGNVLVLDEMDVIEAKILFKNFFRHEKALLHDDEEVERLLKKLTCLPLAIAQACSYISKRTVKVSDYLKLLEGTEKELVKLLSQEFRDSTRDRGVRNAVALTWLVSFEMIKRDEPNAADVLYFLACVENKAIPLSLIPSYNSAGDMIHSIGALIGYSFLSRRGDSDVYDMHRLVHLAMKVWMQEQGIADEWKQRTTSHLADIFPSYQWENRSLWQMYTPHTIRVLQDTEQNTMERADLCLSLGLCLEKDGRIAEAVRWISVGDAWMNQNLAEDDTWRLYARHLLALILEKDGQYKKAIEILEQVVAIKTRVLVEDDASRLASQHQLAVAYKSNGQIKEAIELLEQVVAIRTRVLAEDHPDRLASEHALAMAYTSNGQIKEAIEILEQVVAIERMLAEDDPSRLESQHLLAMAYQSNGQIKEAIEILEQVVTIERMLAEDHPSRLTSQHELAVAYKSNGQIKEAIELLEQVVAIRTRVLAEDHPDRLASEHALAMAYTSNGQIKEAIEILEQVVTIERVLAEDHPSRLASQHELAAALFQDNRTEEALALMKRVVTIKQGSLAADHSRRLVSENYLSWMLDQERNGEFRT